MKPLCIDLFCGLGGWAEGFFAEGYDVVGFDIERHRYPKILNLENGSTKRAGMNWSIGDPSENGRRTDKGNGVRFTSRDCGVEGQKNDGGSWFGVGSPGQTKTGRNPVNGTKVSGDWFGSYAEQKAAGTISPGRLHGKRSQARKAASAEIAKIPFPLANWIAQCFKPSGVELTTQGGNCVFEHP